MTEEQLREFVLLRWRYGRDVRFLVVEAICLGHPLTREQAETIIRAYVEGASENKLLGAASKRV